MMASTNEHRRAKVARWLVTWSASRRLRPFGIYARRTTQAVAEGSTLKAYPADLISVDDHVAALAERYGNLANATRAAIEISDEAGDAGGADIFTAFSRSLDKALWFLESHEADKT